MPGYKNVTSIQRETYFKDGNKGQALTSYESLVPDEPPAGIHF